MSSLYIAYRYGDDAALGGRVLDRLIARFGSTAVAREDPLIVGEAERAREARRAARNSQVVVVVLGTRWIQAQDQSGMRLIDQPQDPLRVLLEEALKRHVRILPLLADGGVMPRTSELPDDLASLTTINALELDSGLRFEDDMRRILTILSQWLGVRNDERHVEGPAQPSLWSRAAHIVVHAIAAVFTVPATIGRRRDKPGIIRIFLAQAVLFGLGTGVVLGMLLQHISPAVFVGLGVAVFYSTLYLLPEWRLLMATLSALPWCAVGWWLGNTLATTIHQAVRTTGVVGAIPIVVCAVIGFFGLALNLSLYRRSFTSLMPDSGTSLSTTSTVKHEEPGAVTFDEPSPA